MTPQRRTQIEEIVIHALELTGGARAAYLDSACGTDSDLRREVESLLAQETRAATFLEIPALEAASRALAAGDSATLSGRFVGPYRVDALLGAGGMGEVYRGWDTRLRRAVALKFLAREFLGDAAAVERFEREARAASALGHPNICTVYDIGETDSRPFIAMEYLEGHNLRARLAGGGFDPREALAYALQIAQGLAAAHQKGIVHRDLKPENLWATPEGHIKILDFGLAKVPEPLANPQAATTLSSEPGRVMGTAGYMSPEQVRGQPLDHRTDIFSFGAILHEMITGARAFRGDSTIDTLIAILKTEPPELADPNINPIVRRCLAKDPDKRFPSATDLVASLEAALLRLASRPAVSPRPLSRRRALQAGGAIAAAGALASLWKFTPARWRNWIPGSGPRFTRLAVLPLANLSGDDDQQYFADGMTDLLITELGQIASLRVIARPSVMQFKGAKTPLKEIARQLGVEALITGSVQSSGTHVRITAQLVDPGTNQQIWTSVYDREVTDVLALQGDVARAIAAEIQARVTADEAVRLASKHKVVPAALDAYLLGKFYWDEFTEDGILKALDYYEQVIQLDPSWAVGYWGLTECWVAFLSIDSRPWAETISKAREAARKALALDNNLAESHHAMGAVYIHEWDWKAAESEYRKTIALNPGLAIAHGGYSDMLRHLGRVEDGIAQAKLALEADPLALQTNRMLGEVYITARRYDLAIAQFQKGLDLHPNNPSLLYQMAWAWFYRRDSVKGREIMLQSQSLEGVDPQLSPDLAYMDALTGKPEEARKTLRQLLELSKKYPVSPGMIALVYIALDDREHSLAWLEKAYARHSSMMVWLKVDQRFDKIRSDPRFQDLMRRVGLI
jgi:serine/threonine protein kinase/tetratricopeptide (TPR) repeat protein